MRSDRDSYPNLLYIVSMCLTQNICSHIWRHQWGDCILRLRLRLNILVLNGIAPTVSSRGGNASNWWATWVNPSPSCVCNSLYVSVIDSLLSASLQMPLTQSTTLYLSIGFSGTSYLFIHIFRTSYLVCNHHLSILLVSLLRVICQINTATAFSTTEQIYLPRH